jgi:hypothetical protein
VVAPASVQPALTPPRSWFAGAVTIGRLPFRVVTVGILVGLVVIRFVVIRLVVVGLVVVGLLVVGPVVVGPVVVGPVVVGLVVGSAFVTAVRVVAAISGRGFVSAVLAGCWGCRVC